jgi:hypothetical protein
MIGIFPPVRWRAGKGASCQMFTGCSVGEEATFRLGYPVEEVDEFRFRWLACAIVTLPLALAALLLIKEHDLSIVAAAFSIIPGLVLTNRVPFFLCQVELRGMASSCFVEHTHNGIDLDEIENRHAGWLSDPTNGYRQDMGIRITKEDAKRRLEELRGRAKRIWTRSWNVSFLEKVKARNAAHPAPPVT